MQAELWGLLNSLHLVNKMVHPKSIVLLQCDCIGALEDPVLKQVRANLVTRHVKGHTSTKDARSWVNRWCDRRARNHMQHQRQIFELSPEGQLQVDLF